MSPDRIKELIGRHLDKGEHLPCRVDEMTPREFEIFKILAERTGFLMYLRGAIDPCVGFKELLAENERLKLELIAAKPLYSRRELEIQNYQLVTENGRLRQWVFATARNMADSGLTIEQYNSITAEVVAAHQQRTPANEG